MTFVSAWKTTEKRLIVMMFYRVHGCKVQMPIVQAPREWSSEKRSKFVNVLLGDLRWPQVSYSATLMTGYNRMLKATVTLTNRPNNQSWNWELV